MYRLLAITEEGEKRSFIGYQYIIVGNRYLFKESTYQREGKDAIHSEEIQATFHEYRFDVIECSSNGDIHMADQDEEELLDEIVHGYYTLVGAYDMVTEALSQVRYLIDLKTHKEDTNE